MGPDQFHNTTQQSFAQLLFVIFKTQQERKIINCWFVSRAMKEFVVWFKNWATEKKVQEALGPHNYTFTKPLPFYSHPPILH